MTYPTITESILSEARELIACNQELRSDDSCIAECCLSAIGQRARGIESCIRSYTNFRRAPRDDSEGEVVERISKLIREDLADIEEACRLLEDAAGTLGTN